jgi:SpoVK/Ycf46/Vps4 family AAA+-type ATPase
MSSQSSYNNPEYLDSLPVYKLTDGQTQAYRRMLDVAGYFFTKSGTPFRAFRGFILTGPPASGKTATALQVAKSLRTSLRRINPPMDVGLTFVDSSTVAAPHWGEAEKRLADTFKSALLMDERHKKIILVDDIDCLMITRGSNVSREWHYSINSVIFHQLDLLDPSHAIVIATTNRIDLVDDALRSRLFEIEVPKPSSVELLKMAYDMVDELGLSSSQKPIVDSIKDAITNTQDPSLRTIQHLIVSECIRSGLWRARI